mmetsp:Transcript_7945/g.28991  ORF Transcript_7945/g.28991 Transcript_7945/m.28991 type:complete len:472 (+) Transcript_7945:73-1488(+)|eukprot:CAMPEP_0203999392 /NCGR_PEP_ID=MMETSP0360-20130528/14563_1 /ASSEMBLY_ACC=CAM_ASM_000342 /TAXON_ID=268821 /ORGANISM="Scrippsiella Hangoei, Strain SHTV-5" /LENGTH=471 /DNA_ID=CAMNT_0050940517 /DNA_START=72 /DNA_END=1487 /DNA_ORIENTATION=+
MQSGEVAPRQDWLVDTPSADGRPARERGLAQKYANAGQVTTLMLRNIPSMYTQDMLLEEIVDCMGSSDFFDFFYLPWDLQNDCNVGYAFVNFRDCGSADRCSRIFTNFNFRKFESRKTCKVYPAHIQGLENNIRHLMNRAVSEAHTHYPIIMWKGEKLKLGKVIAMLDGQRPQQQPPRSAPGRSMGSNLNRDAPTWLPQHGGTLSGMSGSLSGMNVPYGGMGGGDSNIFTEEDSFGSPSALASQFRLSPPPSGAGQPSGPPPGLMAPPLSASGRQAYEIDMLQSLPELRAALDHQVQQIGMGMCSNHGFSPTGMSGMTDLSGMSGMSGMCGMSCMPREAGMMLPSGMGHASDSGMVVMPQSMPGRMPGAMSSGLHRGMHGTHGMQGLHNFDAGLPMQTQGFPQAVPQVRAAQSVQPVAQAPAPTLVPLAAQVQQPVAKTVSGDTEITIKDPDMDVFAKFCQKFADGPSPMG